METRLVLAAALVLALVSPACDSTKSYPLDFVCETPGSAACPVGTVCPALPLGPDTCGDLPGLFGHPPTIVTKGRPVGCRVNLPYGNPYYGDSQQSCTCESQIGSASAAPAWLCPI